jgi:hypothetical protein
MSAWPPTQQSLGSTGDDAPSGKFSLDQRFTSARTDDTVWDGAAASMQTGQRR